MVSLSSLFSALVQPAPAASFRAGQAVNKVTAWGSICNQGVVLGQVDQQAIVEWNLGGVTRERTRDLVPIED